MCACVVVSEGGAACCSGTHTLPNARLHPTSVSSMPRSTTQVQERAHVHPHPHPDWPTPSYTRAYIHPPTNSHLYITTHRRGGGQHPAHAGLPIGPPRAPPPQEPGHGDPHRPCHSPHQPPLFRSRQPAGRCHSWGDAACVGTARGRTGWGWGFYGSPWPTAAATGGSVHPASSAYEHEAGPGAAS